MISDRLGPGDIQAFFDRWAAVIPVPFTPADRAAGYWRELSPRQAGVSRTLVFDAPRQARAFFEALIADKREPDARVRVKTGDISHRTRPSGATPMTDPPDDAALIERSLCEPEAFAGLYDRHSAVLHRYVARRLGEGAADDVVADTFLDAFRKRHRFDATVRDARPWLYGIATNLIGKHCARTAGRDPAPWHGQRSRWPRPPPGSRTA